MLSKCVTFLSPAVRKKLINYSQDAKEEGSVFTHVVQGLAKVNEKNEMPLHLIVLKNEVSSCIMLVRDLSPTRDIFHK